MPFSHEVKTRALLWCDRHCCLCKKACGPNIEVHHIVQESDGGSNDIDQRHLVPPVYYTITNLLGTGPDGQQNKREFPDVGFQLHHYGDSLPVKV
jgi:hypothetical protein